MLLNYIKQHYDISHGVALVTWALVASTSLIFTAQLASTPRYSIVLAGCLFAIYIVIWLYATSIQTRSNRHIRVAFIAIVLCVFGLFFLIPFTYVSILLIIGTCVLPYLTTMRNASIIVALLHLPLYLIYKFYWQESSIFITTVLFYTFALFALTMINSTRKERLAREESEQLNRELKVTQALLKEASEHAERTRIARNIHDLLGHHLTALAIKLQVASHLSDGEAKQHIDECHQLSKLLLSDVREAVSEMRENSAIDMQEAIARIVALTPGIQVSITIAEHLIIDDIGIATTILRTIQESLTNTLKHSQATACDIELSVVQNQFVLNICDSGGNSNATINEGNGLTGIRERVAQKAGTVVYKLTPQGFHTCVSIPMEAA